MLLTLRYIPVYGMYSLFLRAIRSTAPNFLVPQAKIQNWLFHVYTVALNRFFSWCLLLSPSQSSFHHCYISSVNVTIMVKTWNSETSVHLCQSVCGHEPEDCKTSPSVPWSLTKLKAVWGLGDCGKERCTQCFGGKPGGKGPLGRPRCRWK